MRKPNRKRGIPLRCYQCASHNLGNWRRLHNPNKPGKVRVSGATARSVDAKVAPASVCVCEREACVQPFLGSGYAIVDTRDGLHDAAPDQPKAEEFIIGGILAIAKEEDEGPGYDVLVEWVGYPKDDSTWETLSAMLDEDAELVKRELRGLEDLSWEVRRELSEKYGFEL